MRKRITSLLLTLVMLLSLVPAMGVTALAAGNYPSSVVVYNASGTITSLNDGQCLVTNDGSATNYTGGTYVARYEKSSGTLFLKGYHGVGTEGGIAALGDLNIKVEGDSIFTTSRISNENLMGIQASGKLTISGSGKLTLHATAPRNVYGIFAKEGIEISAPLEMDVATSNNGSVYGIYTEGGAISLSVGEKTITAGSGSTGAAYAVYNNVQASSTGADNGKIDIRGKLTVTLNQDGTNYGIYTGSGGLITLEDATANISGKFDTVIYNNNGNVVIKNSPDVTLISTISGGKGVYARYGGNLRIENSTVTVSAKDITANVEKGKLFIKDSIVDLKLDDTWHLVVKTDSNAENTIDLSGTGSVTLTALGNQNSAMINDGKVTVTPGTKLEKGTPNVNSYSGAYDTASNTTVLKFVHDAAASTTYTVSFDANGGTGTMADVTGVSGEYTLPANGFTAPGGKQFKAWSVGGSEKAVGDKITVTANTTVTAVWENIPVVTYTVSFDANGGTGTMADVTGVSGEYTLPANGFTAPGGKQFKAWSVGGSEKAVGDKITVTANTTVTAVWEPIPVTEYTITFDGNGGTPSALNMTTVGKKLSSLPTATRSGSYSFDGWYTAASGGTQITTAYTFSANTTVYAHWTYTGGGGGWYYTYYTIKATAGTNGSISPSGWTSVRDGRDQTFTITPDKGYAVAKVLVDGKSVGAVKSYTFKNVTKDHTIEAIFMKSNGNPQTGVFVDVAEGSYYEEAIDWAVEKGITNGVSSNMFAPNDPCTRAHIVTFLWRAAGSPAPKSMSSFTDVPADAFYAKAVAWAVENGITSGTGEGKFSPNSTCTRAQAVTFLYRASGSPAVSGKAEFSDVSTTAFYADAVAWAAKKGITTGIGGGLFGSDNDCTRGQIVTFLWRAMAE